MSSPQVALYKYEGTEWVQTDIQGTLFVYERKCEPCYGFLILNRLSSNNLIQPITKDIELQDKTPFLLYKTKEINGIWFYETANCKKLYQIISQVMNKMSTGQKSNPDIIMNKTNEPKSNIIATGNGTSGASLVDLLNKAGSKEKSAPVQSSPSGGEKLLRLLSHQGEPPMIKPNGDSVAAFFAQVSQSSTVAPPPNPLQSLLAKPGAMSLEALENDKPMPPLPSHATTASDLESDIKTKKSPDKKTKAVTTTPKSSKVKVAVKEEIINGSSVSYASVAKTTQPPLQPQVQTQVQPQPPPPTLTEEKPQLMSPMVFSATNPVQPQVQAPPVIAPQPLLPPMNGISPAKPQITPLTEAQLLQAFRHLLQTSPSFVGKLHQAYVESLNGQLN